MDNIFGYLKVNWGGASNTKPLLNKNLFSIFRLNYHLEVIIR